MRDRKESKLQVQQLYSNVEWQRASVRQNQGFDRDEVGTEGEAKIRDSLYIISDSRRKEMRVRDLIREFPLNTKLLSKNTYGQRTSIVLDTQRDPLQKAAWSTE